jgi:hypothetical protein
MGSVCLFNFFTSSSSLAGQYQRVDAAPLILERRSIARAGTATDPLCLVSLLLTLFRLWFVVNLVQNLVFGVTILPDFGFQ